MIEGEIVRGQGLGAKRLYPTINLAVTRFLAPLDGVYASQTEVLGALYKSVSFVGQRLSADGAFAIESHIIDESFKDFAGKSEAEQPRSAAIFFAERLRENKRFDDLSNLKAQITNDIAAAKLLLE
jgi:riboflavin kinase/FMN adenylyltransferase